MVTSGESSVADTGAAEERATEMLPLEEYNFSHFRTRHLIYDAVGTLQTRGIPPGTTAPEFVLPRVGGGLVRLSDLRDRPTLLHFGSYT
jgi:hypothetical protein